MDKLTKEQKLLLKRFEGGQYLKQLRTEKGISLAELGKTLGVSANFLSNIERGLKMPSDTLIRQLADCYGIEEELIFDSFGKIPLVARDELEGNKHMNDLLTDIGKNQKLSDQEKHHIYEEIHKFYKKLIDKHNQ